MINTVKPSVSFSGFVALPSGNYVRKESIDGIEKVSDNIWNLVTKHIVSVGSGSTRNEFMTIDNDDKEFLVKKLDIEG